MKLLGHDGSPYVRKVRIVLEEKRVPYEHVPARPSAPGSPVAEWNPLGKIPVLVTDEGAPIYDSRVIIEYLEGITPEPRLVPSEFDARIEVKRWEALADGIADATVLTSHDYDKVQTAEWHQKQRLKIQRGLGTMERDLGTSQFCFGDRLTLADIATGMALGYLDRVVPDIDWRTPHPRLKALAERLAQRPSFQKTLLPA